MRSVLLVLGLTLADVWAATPPVPPLQIDAPPSLQPAAARLRDAGSERLRPLMRLAGLEEPGAPIRVVLVAESEEAARRTPAWIAGAALPDQDLIVLFPERSPHYPDESLEEVLRHEVAHVLIQRAAGEQVVPRWFSEGAALLAERPWGLEDFTRSTWELVRSRDGRLSDVDAAFHGDAGDRVRAYALSGAIVRDLQRRYGPDLVARVLGGMRTGLPFAAALRRETGRSLAAIEADFWARHRLWRVWLPVLTSPQLMWFLIAGLAVVAFVRHRRRRAERRRRWAEEEDAPGPGE